MNTDRKAWGRGGLLVDRWRRHAEERPDEEAIVHWIAGEEPYRWTWGSMLAEAERLAGVLASEGVRRGEVCALILRHHRAFYPTYLAIAACGAIPAVLAYPNSRLHPDKFRQGLSGMARHSGLDWILTERDLDPIVRPLVAQEGCAIRGLLWPLEWDGRVGPRPTPAVASHEPCLLQHSSGTTGLQKGVLLSHAAVLGHLGDYGDAINLGPDDKVASWLPLYHDMGLIAAFHLPLAYGIPSIQIDPFEWVQAPFLLLDAVSRERATIAWLPNFAYNFMATRIVEEDVEDVRLDSVRLLVNCSEPVRAESHERFATRFAANGLRREALSACYAMAETTFAVAQTRPGQPAPEVQAARDELAHGRFRRSKPGEAARTCVSSGVPIGGCDVRVVDADDGDLPEDMVGELLIRSTSMFSGYRNQPTLTAAALDGEWYRSGDFGFRHAGEIYVIGRKKDLIIVAGKNIYPEDVESVVERTPGVTPGRVVAFGLEDPATGTESIAVLAEADVHGPKRDELIRAIKLAGASADLTLTHVHLAPPRWLVKSSSGKLSRQSNKERFLALVASPLKESA